MFELSVHWLVVGLDASLKAALLALLAAGVLRLLQWPSGESIRVDAGFATGDEVPPTYDSLLGKVIAWAPSRERAAERWRATSIRKAMSPNIESAPVRAGSP